MSDFKLTSLEVLAEAAMFHCANQENDSLSINCSSAPIKRKHYLLDRYEAEQNGLNSAAGSFMQGRLNSNSSGYSSSSTESEPKSPSDEYPSSSPSSSPEPYQSCSTSNSPTGLDHGTTSTSPKPKKAATVNSATGKKSQASRSRKASSTGSSPTGSPTGSPTDVQRDYLNEFAKKVIITPKVDNLKAGADLRNEVFNDNVKIEVKTPKLTYTLRAMRKRKPSTKTPDHLKDREYYEKRKRNNLAARKSRNNKNAAIKSSALKLAQLENERKELDWNLGKEIMVMKFLQEKMKADPVLKEHVMNLVDENELAYFRKVLELK